MVVSYSKKQKERSSGKGCCIHGEKWMNLWSCVLTQLNQDSSFKKFGFKSGLSFSLLVEIRFFLKSLEIFVLD